MKTPKSPTTGSALAQQFDKDLRFFQVLLLLINKTCPIRNIDLVWTDTEPEVRAGLRGTTGTTQALSESCSKLLRCEQTNPNPRFCDLVNDHGRDLCCMRSDKAAELRVKATGRSEVYRCHAGLIDIAVPVLCDGRHIATLYSGQVMTSPPSAAEFIQIQQNIARLTHIDPAELASAYEEVPVVTHGDIQQAVGLLEMFADYLATAWKRLQDAVEAQERRMRDAQLDCKEMAHILLDGGVSDRKRFRELSRAVGFTRFPNRVLVVKPQAEDEYRASYGSFDLGLTRLIYAVEELCGKVENVMCSYLRQRGICIFVAHPEGTSESRDVKAYALAQRLLYGIAERCDMPVRIGIGRRKADWQALPESYQEAVTALAKSESLVALYKRPPAAVRALSSQMTTVCQAISERRLREAKVELRLLPILANESLGERTEELPAQRQLFASALESMLIAARDLGLGSDSLTIFRQQANERFELASSVFDVQESWVEAANSLIDDVARLYSGKHDKLISRAQAIIIRRLENVGGRMAVSLDAVAREVGVSAGHLSRTFKKITGMTFERYLMVKRIERARQLLLDPASRVSEVAEKCDFCNPAYFARVFRKLAGCSPTEYSKDPLNMARREMLQ